MTANREHSYKYRYPNAFTLAIQKIVNSIFKKFLEAPVKDAIIEDEAGKKQYDLSLYNHLNWVYRTGIVGGWIINSLPPQLKNSIIKSLQKYGFDFSKFLMAGLPHQKFKKSTSLIFIPDSKENQLRTSDGKMILPHLLVIEMLKRVCAYDPEQSIAQGYFCVCRKTRNCKNHPQELGCMIVGPGAPDVVERGIGRFITLDKAIEIIKTVVMPRSLSSFISVFPSDLHYFWGVKTHHSKYSFEVCFCCTCCCILKRPHFFITNEPIIGNEPFVDIRGFRAKIDLNKCTGIGDCVEYCPLHRIKLIDVIDKDGKITKKATNKNCIGCGTCVSHCPNKAIEIEPTESFDKLEDLLGIFEYYDLKKEEFLQKLNKKYHQINKKL